MSVRQTSLESYNQDIRNLKENTQAKAIYDLLKLNKMTNNEIVQELGYPINVVTARVNLLHKKGLVSCVGYKIDIDTHKKNMVWSV